MHETQSLLTLLYAGEDRHANTGCLILSDKSYREESTGCSGIPDWVMRGYFLEEAVSP